MKSFAFPLLIFVIVGLFLTFNILHLPSLVIGDNFHWVQSNIDDIIGPKVIRESYMGDVGILSTFKAGYLYPLTYILVAFNLPSTIVYPLLFYVLALTSFYFFSKEFIKNEALRILAAILYLINPVTPYYYTSIINAFSVALLPVALMFFVRSLRELRSQEKASFVRNLAFTALFLGLTVSANEQFILSIVLVTVFLTTTFLIASYKKWGGFTRNFARNNIMNFSVFGLVIVIVCMPLIISLGTIQSAPLSTYFQGPSAARFIQTIQYNYRNVDFVTLLRLGGDSGVGLGASSWYDSNIMTNYFGYVLPGFFVLSILVLCLSKTKLSDYKLFFLQSVFLFIVAFVLILLMGNLTSGTFSNESLSLMLKTWESPMKLRVLLLLSVLTVILLPLRLIDLYSGRRKKIIIGLTLAVLVSTTVVYNSPWLINYAGQTTLQEVADASRWGTLYSSTYVEAANNVEQQSINGRGIILPFTHKAELYSDPNTRVFQIVSAVNDGASSIVAGGNISWSKGLGLFSIKSLAVMNSYDPNEGIIFPRPVAYNMSYTLQQIKNDKELKFVNKSENYLLYQNPNALPLTYASNNYVFYDDVETLKYAFDFLNFTDLPVFLNEQNSISQLTVPLSISSGTYQLHALGLISDNTDNLAVNILNGGNARVVQLQKQQSGSLSDFSARTTLSPGDQINVMNMTSPQRILINDQTLNCTEYPVGSYGSFTLDFTVSILERGNMSFLSPRVLIDTGNEVYFIILHDNGFVELAVLKDNIFYSAVIYQFVGYSLLDPSNQINVKVTRQLDDVNVYVNGNKYFIFPIAPKIAKVSLVSEMSMSAFTNINVTESNLLRLFAARQDYMPIAFKTQKESAESSSLTLSYNGTDAAVVSQYLYNNLRNIQNLPATSFKANVFFQGWILNTTQPITNKVIQIDVDSRQLFYVLTGSSIFFTYAMLLYIGAPTVYIRIYHKLQFKRKKGEANE